MGDDRGPPHPTRSAHVAHCQPRWELDEPLKSGGTSYCCLPGSDRLNSTATRLLTRSLDSAASASPPPAAATFLPSAPITSARLHVVELRTRRDEPPAALRPAMRDVVWANLGVSDAPVDVALFVRSGRAMAADSYAW